MYKKTRFNKEEDIYKQSFEGVEILVVPDEQLSLAEILERFSREESLDVGKPTFYDDNEDSDEDLEKLRYMDNVDKYQYVQQLKVLQDEFTQKETLRLEMEKKQEWEKQILERKNENQKQNPEGAA